MLCALFLSIALISLGLSHNRIGDDGAEALAEMLRENNTLESLSLSANDIGGEGGDKIIAALTQNTSLRSLMLAEVSGMGIGPYSMGIGPYSMGTGPHSMGTSICSMGIGPEYKFTALVITF